MSAIVVAVGNQKGGVGKTTTTVNLGHAFAASGVPTLIVDLDPQANATSALGFEKKPGAGIYGPLRETVPPASRYRPRVQKTCGFYHPNWILPRLSSNWVVNPTTS